MTVPVARPWFLPSRLDALVGWEPIPVPTSPVRRSREHPAAGTDDERGDVPGDPPADPAQRGVAGPIRPTTDPM